MHIFFHVKSQHLDFGPPNDENSVIIILLTLRVDPNPYIFLCLDENREMYSEECL